MNGMKVTMRFERNSIFEGRTQTLRHVTEIHYRYPTVPKDRMRIAFESDIRGTGDTYDVDNIAEFEATLETEEYTA